KQELLSPAEYDEMVASTTRLNTPGTELSEISDVHAATDVTGFGLLGHASEMARGAGLQIVIEKNKVPVFEGARHHAQSGIKTGASGRNWDSVSHMVTGQMSAMETDLLCDPQTSGGLLVSCSPEAAHSVLETFRRHGHADAAIIGRVKSGAASVRVE
ncbi:MAG TPA: selenide, water dikinase SelD, partial [Hyphomonas sp.]|nr:selenide, water dikinase SelD [Hyphomonas sp.]